MALAGTSAAFFILNQAVCDKKSTPTQSLRAEPVVAERAASATTDRPQRSPKENPRRVLRSRTGFTTWGRDPFAEAFRLAKFDSSRSDSTNFVLRGVIWKGNEAYVLIGNDIFKEGERHGDLTVVSIEKDRVVCKKRGRTVTLVLNHGHD